MMRRWLLVRARADAIGYEPPLPIEMEEEACRSAVCDDGPDALGAPGGCRRRPWGASRRRRPCPGRVAGGVIGNSD